MTDDPARIYVREVVDIVGQPLVVVGKLRRGALLEGMQVSVGSGGLLFAKARITGLQRREALPDDDDVAIMFEAPDRDHRWLLKEICVLGETIGVIENNEKEG